MTREDVALVSGTGGVTGCALPLAGAGESRKARSALAAMRDDTFAPSRIGNLQMHCFHCPSEPCMLMILTVSEASRYQEGKKEVAPT